MSFLKNLFGSRHDQEEPNPEPSQAPEPEPLPIPEFGTFTDPRDGQTYKTVKIGNQIWMAENLNFDAEDGCFAYNSSLSNAKKFGRLYDWETACKVAPNGWHLPSIEEWQELIDFLGGKKVAGKKMKSTTGWQQNGNGTNESGFNALPGGCRLSGRDSNMGYAAYFLSSSEHDTAGRVHGRSLDCSSSEIYFDSSDKKDSFSVRCIKDEN